MSVYLRYLINMSKLWRAEAIYSESGSGVAREHLAGCFQSLLLTGRFIKHTGIEFSWMLQIMSRKASASNMHLVSLKTLFLMQQTRMSWHEKEWINMRIKDIKALPARKVKYCYLYSRASLNNETMLSKTCPNVMLLWEHDSVSILTQTEMV